jgi:hypothetical protein
MGWPRTGSRGTRAVRRRVLEEVATSSRPHREGRGELVTGCVFAHRGRGAAFGPADLTAELATDAVAAGRT